MSGQQQQQQQQQKYYPPPPGPAPGGKQPPVVTAQQQFPVSPPADRTQFFPPPPQGSPGTGQAGTYPSSPPPPPPPPPSFQPSPTGYPSPSLPGTSIQSPHHAAPQQYAPPPQQTYQQTTARHYPPPPPPPPPSSPPAHNQSQQQVPLTLRPAPSGGNYNQQQQEQLSQFEPPPKLPDSDAAYPPEKDGHRDEPLNTSDPTQLVSGAPPAGHFIGAGAVVDDVGTFNGGSYRISHRDTNTILTIQLAIGCPFQAKPGAMIAMSPTMQLRGELKFSVKKMITGTEMSTSRYVGPGELLLAPPMLGDITSIRLTGQESWVVGHDAFLAATQGVIKDHKRQGLGKAMFSGEGLFVYRISGTGILWITSFGAIIRKDLVEDEKYIVDNGHLVAWNTKYILERVASGGIISNIASAEGLVCKFTGPGTVFIQTRNPKAFSAYMGGQAVQG
ncbi:DUF124 domain-containing protein [Moelleriella libera RCEF 2490]|uniref:Altered inheritance of mitochondria protein 24, mitochondrial n=1 Tax=Moelleriella libera RCEF 2490 TaxID=1081109 RepID=A0A166VCD6_9HYPO|nr:DUF124 domain-containing protein [Moelleriella libera RCEF 2490]